MDSNGVDDASSYRPACVRASLIGVGLLFFCAALFKVHAQWTAAPILGTWIDSRPVQFGVITFEFLFATWLMVTPHLVKASRIVRGVLLILCAYSLWHVIAGADSCGCLGRVRTHPLWSTIVDALLWSWLAYITPRAAPEASRFVTQPRANYVRLNYMRAIVAIISASLSWLVVTGTKVGEGALSLRAGELVVLEPHSWVGQQLPIIDYIETASDVLDHLRHGETTVVLVRHDCHACEQSLPRYQSLARQERGNVVLIEVPPWGDKLSGVVAGKLSAKMAWFVQTPAEIMLRDGVVTHVAQGPSLSDSAN